MSTFNLFHFFNLLLLLLSTVVAATSLHHYNHHRHLLHQPFFPVTVTSPTESPSSSPPQPDRNNPQPKYPFSTIPTAPQTPFFPSYHLSPPPPPPPSSLVTLPANISSILFPQQPPSSPSHHVRAILIAVSTTALSATLLVSILIFALLFKHRHRSLSSTNTIPEEKSSRLDSLRLFPPNTSPSDVSGHLKQPQPQPPCYTSGNSSSEFLYLGTLVNSRSGLMEQEYITHASNAGIKIGGSVSAQYQKLGSPELRPLPPLPRYDAYRSGEQSIPSGEVEMNGDKADDAEYDEFFSPRASPGRKESPTHDDSRTAPNPFSITSSPSNSITETVSPVTYSNPRSLKLKSPDSIFDSPAQTPPVSTSDISKQFFPVTLPPPPPPPPPPSRLWEIPVKEEAQWGPPPLITPSRPENATSGEESKRNEWFLRNEESTKPKLKPLHWDKVRASSDRAMAWDQIKTSSFQLNEEMIETLFMVNNSNSNTKETGWRHNVGSMNEDNRVLDPKKSQNISILLRALNVTIVEVCEALSEGNTDTLGTELLESLFKMAPTEEEERKLKDFKDESPFKLGSAEKFLKAVIDVPFAFKRVDAMLYIANFDSELDYLRGSFETLVASCEELKNGKMFLKLLDAVLKTGNRMNVGTNRGDAHAFKLDTLLKLVDVKGTDGRTTLLHFVVQEIIKSEGTKISGANLDLKREEKTEQSVFQHDVESRKLGLQVVSSLCGELINVKKAASMDSDMLSNEVMRLANGITKINEVVKLMNEGTEFTESSRKFSESMTAFLKRAEEEIVNIRTQESFAFSMVKEVTEYFHGNSAKEEAHPLRIFTVVRDFLSVLDNVCKEVGKVNERTLLCSLVRPMPVNPTIQPVFPIRRFDGSSDDE